MPERNSWFMALSIIRPFIFKIDTPNGFGTGFLVFNNDQGICGVATAYHVVSHAYEWEEAIKVMHFQSKASRTLKCEVGARYIEAYPEKDLAFILFRKQDMPLPGDSLKLIGSKQVLNQGVELGWYGFPLVARGELSFFSGFTSCYLSREEAYLVDGVAIHGVSGGPAFYLDGMQPRVCGVISEYWPNRASGEPWPGVSLVRSVEPYQNSLRQLTSLDEARRKAVAEQGELGSVIQPSPDQAPSPAKDEG